MNTKALLALLLALATTLAAKHGISAMSDDHAMHDMHAHQAQMFMNEVGMTMPAESATKVLQVSLSDDLRIDFGADLSIDQNEVVHFIVKNIGTMKHEFSISSLSERKAHMEMMRKMPGMKHEDANTLSLEPGQTGEITWHFTGKPQVIFSCNVPGHAEAGMIQMVQLKTGNSTSQTIMDKPDEAS